jgi:hypothetical protein
MRRFLALGLVLAAVSACAGATATPHGGELESSDPATSTPAVTAAGPSSPVPSDATQTAGPTANAGVLRPGMTAVTLAEGIRLRSLPETGDVSIKYQPLLPAGTKLYVVDGPVSASGYEWIRVVPISFEARHPEGWGEPDGWLAVSSREGDPWVTAAAIDCPAAPTGVAELRLGMGERLACFGGVPITFQARLVRCDCDIDGPAIEPGWFMPSDLVLIDPTASDNPVDMDRATLLALDPAADVHDPLPVDRLVEVTGMFDHPAAAACRVGGFDTPPEPSLECRFFFTVTSLKAL